MFEGRVLVGRYRLLSKLGSGGMGSVWRARDLTLNADVAVKLIDPQHASSPEALTRFRREAQAAAAIRSTYVVQIIDYGIDRAEPFIAMELLNGESLGQRLTRSGKLGFEATATLFGQVGRALSLAHERDIVHRDLKPDNVFLVREGEEDIGKVLDFGIARALSLSESDAGVATRTGAVLGSPYYMSPEQANGEPLDASTDIWSFGVMASECLLGRRPFKAETLAHLFHAICMAPLPVPSSLGDVPAGFDAWFARAVARDRAYRYASIRQAADELKAICLARPSSHTLADGGHGPPRLSPAPEPAGAASHTHTVTSVHFDGASHSAGMGRAGARSGRSATLVVGGIIGVALAGAFAWSRTGSAVATSASVGAKTQRDAAPSAHSIATNALPHVPEEATLPTVASPPSAAVANSAPASSATPRAALAIPAVSSSPSANATKLPRPSAPPRFEPKPKPPENAAGI
jgi:serine/threonine protein kinase